MNRIFTIFILIGLLVGCKSIVEMTKQVTQLVEETSQNTTQSSENIVSTPTIPDSEMEIADFLCSEYEEYLNVYTTLNNSDAKGEDVETAYYASQTILKEIERKTVPENMAQMKSNLYDGIALQSQGFGCYSNETLCKDDLEATRLLFQGYIKLQDFKSDCKKYY